VGRPPSAPGEQVAATVATIAELFRMNRLGPVDAARMETTLGLAELCDINPWNAPLWGVYRRALAELQAQTD